VSVRTRAVRWGAPEARTADTGRPVLFVHHGADRIRGSERALLDLMDGLDRSRYVPVLWCSSRTLASEAERLGMRVLVGRGWEATSHTLLPPRALVTEAREALQTHRVALIHANSCFPLKWLVPAARAARIPVVAHLHGILGRESRLNLFLHQATHVVAVSEVAAQGPRSDGLEAVSVIHDGVDPGLADGPVETFWRRRLGLAPATLTLIGVGALVQTKGVDTLLRALRRLRVAEGRDVALVLVGDGPERGALTELAAELDVADRVHFVGQQRDVGLALRSLGHVFVSASRVEAFSLSTLEASCCGLPVVVSDVPAHRELVIPDVTGTLVRVDDDGALAAAVACFLDDEAARRSVGSAAQARALAEFTLGRYVREFEALYERLLSCPRREYGWWRGSRWPSVYRDWFAHAVRKRLGRSRRVPA
jgi:glycosyltransferase involved in cell wall biosynthesis